jgi:hypothetical protein
MKNASEKSELAEQLKTEISKNKKSWVTVKVQLL